MKMTLFKPKKSAAKINIHEDATLKYLEYPENWLYNDDYTQGSLDMREKLTMLQHICFELCCAPGHSEKMSRREKFVTSLRIRSLIRSGADLTIKHSIFDGVIVNTLLLEALSSEHENEDLAEILIDLAIEAQKPELLIMGSEGTYSPSTPLMFALKSGRSTALIKKLIIAIKEHIGTDGLNVQDSQGLTALHLACFLGNVELIECLVDKGADVSLEASGEIPLDCYLYPFERYQREPHCFGPERNIRETILQILLESDSPDVESGEKVLTSLMETGLFCGGLFRDAFANRVEEYRSGGEPRSCFAIIESLGFDSNKQDVSTTGSPDCHMHI